MRKQVSAEARLCVLFATVNHSKEELSEIEELLKNDLSWIRLENLLKKNKLFPMVGHFLEKHPEVGKINEKLVSQIQLCQSELKVENRNRIETSKIFLERFRKDGIKVILLKGISIAESVYGNFAYKKMNDIDILVKKEDLPKVFKIYDGLNYFHIGEGVNGGREAKDTHFVAPTHISQDLSCIIGTQWGIKSPKLGYHINYNGIWSRAKELDFYGVPTLKMCHEDLLHHLCLHLGLFKCSIRDMMDIFNLIESSENEFSWGLFDQIVRETGSEEAVYHALSVSNFLKPNRSVQKYLDSLQISNLSLFYREAKNKQKDLDVYVNSSIDYVQDLEKLLTRYMIARSFKSKLDCYKKLAVALIYPPKEAFCCLNQLDQNKPLPMNLTVILKRALTPFKLVQTVAICELGWKMTILYLVGLHIDLALAAIKSPFKKNDKRDDLEVYADKIGVKLERLQWLEGYVQ